MVEVTRVDEMSRSREKRQFGFSLFENRTQRVESAFDMISGLYSAAAAMQSATHQHEAIARNLAHAQMPGYKRMNLLQTPPPDSFESALSNALAGGPQGSHSSEIQHDFSQGPLEKTDRVFDLALQGEGFFVVEGKEGPLYTRNGSFHLSADGRLVTADDLPVQGESGDIRIEGADRPITVTQDGTIKSGEVSFGQIKVVRFSDPQQLQPAGVTLYSAPEEAGPLDAEKAVILQGMQERSNVSPIQELVEMIAAQRRHEAAQRSMTLLNESMQKRINVNSST
ncbi:flagellar hook-basal body protein [Planctomicrobium sp. SH664]|uniref:flagellar hook-basal body protein n=1 Tax=Planctomicrobium sp. SH664 TaxID=3448125 RepID=UPI003F5B1D7F